MKPHLISVKEFCSILGIGRTSAYQILGSQGVKSIKIGRRRLILRSSVEKLVKRAVQQGDV